MTEPFDVPDGPIAAPAGTDGDALQLVQHVVDTWLLLPGLIAQRQAAALVAQVQNRDALSARMRNSMPRGIYHCAAGDVHVASLFVVAMELFLMGVTARPTVYELFSGPLFYALARPPRMQRRSGSVGPPRRPPMITRSSASSARPQPRRPRSGAHLTAGRSLSAAPRRDATSARSCLPRQCAPLPIGRSAARRFATPTTMGLVCA